MPAQRAVLGCGLGRRHSPPGRDSVERRVALQQGTVKNLMRPASLRADATSSKPPSTQHPGYPLRGICIFDCPEASHTSPTRILSSVRGSPSEIVIVYGVKLAAGVRTATHHSPVRSVTVVYALPSHDGVTVTVEPGSAVPQMRASAFCWSTMSDVIIDAGLTRPCADRATITMAATDTNVWNLMVRRYLFYTAKIRYFPPYVQTLAYLKVILCHDSATVSYSCAYRQECS